MPFVGVVLKKSEEKQIAKIIKQNNIICINEKTIQNIRNIKFETILMNTNLMNSKDEFRKILENLKYLIINADLCDLRNNKKFKFKSYNIWIQ